MKLLSRYRICLTKFKIQRKYCSKPEYIYPSEKDNYTKVPQYPPIDLIDPESEEGKKKQWYDKIKRQLTVEEKLFEINVQRRWGWKCFMIREGVIPLNNQVFAQHVTKTHVIETENLPSHYKNFSERSKALSEKIKNDVIDSIEYQLSVRRRRLSELAEPLDQEKELTRFIITDLNRVLMNILQEDEPHLKGLQIDIKPRIEASWKIESLVETYVKKCTGYQIADDEIPEEYLDRPSDKYIQYLGYPILQMRAQHFLPRLIDVSEANVLGYAVPVYEYDPHVTLGYEMERRFLNNIPGFWPGEDRECCFLSYHLSNHTKYRPPTFGPEDTREALVSQALFASFGWLLPIACYHGFSSFHDVTYPMATQTVLTDGKEFTFASYQLNTTEMHWKNINENLKCNICWVTPTKPLYETVENGKLKGFNEEVFQTLLQFYLNTPKPLENVQLKPYLGYKVKHIADYVDNEKVKWLEEKFKYCCCNNRWYGSRGMYELYDWERIYKVMFPSRPLDPRRRPFELRQNPYLDKLSDAPEEYIPKVLRVDKDLPKWRQRKYRKTFFPK